MFVLEKTQLEQYAEKFLQDNYQIGMEVPLKINNRLKRSCGQFVHGGDGLGNNISKRVELNGYMVNNNPPSLVLDILRHELVHYALFEMGITHSDGSIPFENELKRLDIVSQYNILDKYPDLKASPEILYECPNCKNVFTSSKKLPNDGANHYCTDCGAEKGKLKNVTNRKAQTA